MANLELKTASGGSVTLVPEDGVSNVTALIKSVNSTLVNEDDIANVVRDIDFTQSIGINGYQILPSGLIIQWGSTPLLSGTADTTVTLPLAFPNAFFKVVASGGYSGNGSVPPTAGFEPSTKSQFVARASASGFSYRYIAIGS